MCDFSTDNGNKERKPESGVILFLDSKVNQ